MKAKELEALDESWSHSEDVSQYGFARVWRSAELDLGKITLRIDDLSHCPRKDMGTLVLKSNGTWEFSGGKERK